MTNKPIPDSEIERIDRVIWLRQIQNGLEESIRLDRPCAFTPDDARMMLPYIRIADGYLEPEE